MDIYISLYFILLISSLIPNKRKEFYYVIFIIMICIAGFRGDSVGVDTWHYHSIFEVIGNDGYHSAVEPGWNLLNRGISKIGGNFLELLTVVSLFTLLPVFFVSNKCSPYIYFSIFVFYGLHLYSGAFNLVAQYLAISITFLAYYYFYIKKVKIAIALWIIACTFHYSCIFAVVALFFTHKKSSFKNIIILVVSAFVLGSIANEQIIDFITLSHYTRIASFRENVFVAGLMTIALDALFITIAYTSPKALLNNFWGKLFVLSIVVFNATYTLHFSARIYSIFAISQVIFLPLYVKYSAINKYLSAGLVIFYVSIQFWRIYLTNGNNILPYEINYFDLSKSIFSFLYI